MRRTILTLFFVLVFSTSALAESNVQYTLDGKNVDSSVVLNNGQVNGSFNSHSFFHFRRMGRVAQKSTICIGKVKCKANLRMSASQSSYSNLNK